jgi:hypothetical protein
LAIIASAFALSLVPFLVTNYLISGNPLEPPRFLTPFISVNDLSGLGGSEAPTNDGGSSGSSSESDAGTGGDISEGGEGDNAESGGGVDLKRWLPAEFVALLQIGLFRYAEGVQILVTDLDRVSTVFFREKIKGVRRATFSSATGQISQCYRRFQ